MNTIFIVEHNTPTLGLRAGDRLYIEQREPQEGDRLMICQEGTYKPADYIELEGEQFAKDAAGSLLPLHAVELVGVVNWIGTPRESA